MVSSPASPPLLHHQKWPAELCRPQMGGGQTATGSMRPRQTLSRVGTVPSNGWTPGSYEYCPADKRSFPLAGFGCGSETFLSKLPNLPANVPALPSSSPLIPLPIIEVPFNRIGMNLVSPLPRSRTHPHLSGLWYPEAILLHKAMARKVHYHIVQNKTRDIY